MKIFNIDPRKNRMPTDFPIQKKAMKIPRINNPNIGPGTNDAVVNQIKQYSQFIDPKKIRQDFRIEILRRVDDLNAFIANNTKYRSIRFGTDEAAGKFFAVVQDAKTGKVLKQYPSDAALTRAEILRDVSGLMQDISI